MGDVGQGDVVAIWGCGAPAVCLRIWNKGMIQHTSNKQWLKVFCIMLRLWLQC